MSELVERFMALPPDLKDEVMEALEAAEAEAAQRSGEIEHVEDENDDLAGLDCEDDVEMARRLVK